MLVSSGSSCEHSGVQAGQPLSPFHFPVRIRTLAPWAGATHVRASQKRLAPPHQHPTPRKGRWGSQSCCFPRNCPYSLSSELISMLPVGLRGLVARSLFLGSPLFMGAPGVTSLTSGCCLMCSTLGSRLKCPFPVELQS